MEEEQIILVDDSESKFWPEVWQILRECDNEFYPPLSSRSSTFDTTLDQALRSESNGA